MKKWPARALLVLLCIVMLSSSPAYAAEERASDRIMYSTATLSKKSNGDLSIYFSVQGAGKMDVIGASSVVIQRSSGNGWVTEYTFNTSNTPALLVENSDWNGMVLTYSPRLTGVSYRAVVMIFAKNAFGESSQQLIST